MRRLMIAALLLVVSLGTARAGEEPTNDDPLARAAARLTTGSVDDVRRAMASSDPVVRRAAAIVAARRIGESAALLDELLAATGDDDPGVRLTATRAIGATGEAAARGAVRLARLAERAADDVQRRAAAAALVRISPALEQSQRLLIDPAGRDLVFGGLSDLGTEAVPALERLAASESWRVRARAGAALVSADPTSARTRRVVETLLRDESSAVRCAALEAIPLILGGGLLTDPDVTRAFSADGSPRERMLLIVALADEGLPGSATDAAVRIAALQNAVAGGVPYQQLAAVRMVHATGLSTDAALVTLAGLTNGADVRVSREAMATIWHAAAAAPLSRAVATTIQVLLAAGPDDDVVAATAALALARGGQDTPELTRFAARRLVTYAWPSWPAGPMRRAPVSPESRGRRSLRAGGGRWFGVTALPGVPLPGPSDVMPLLAAHPDAATPCLAQLLEHDAVATRAVAAWVLAEVRQDDEASATRLLPLLDDPALAVRIVCCVRLARSAAHADAAARSAVAMLVADEEPPDATVVRDARDDSVLGDGGDLQWTEELVEVLSRAPSAALDALLDAQVACAAPVMTVSLDEATGEQVRTVADDLADLPGARHIPAMLDAIGDASRGRLLGQALDGEPLRRRAAVRLLGAGGDLPDDVRARLETLRDDPVIGADVRMLATR